MQNLAHFDVLPAKLATTYGRPGVRPDLLFDFGPGGEEGGRLAGEARGRSEVRPGKPTVGQRKRLNEIVAWSGQNDCHPVTMTYTFTWHDRLHVDLHHVKRPDTGNVSIDPVSASEEAERAALLNRLPGRALRP